MYIHIVSSCDVFFVSDGNIIKKFLQFILYCMMCYIVIYKNCFDFLIFGYRVLLSFSMPFMTFRIHKQNLQTYKNCLVIFSRTLCIANSYKNLKTQLKVYNKYACNFHASKITE